MSDPDQASADEARELDAGLRRAAELIRSFYEDLEGRAVAPAFPASETARAFEGTLGEEGVGLKAALEDVERTVIPRAMGIPHPLYLGLINSSPLPGGIVAESIIGALNNNGGSWIQSPPFSAAEEEVVRCLRGVLRLPRQSTGFVLPGGSYTALHGLQLARDQRLPQWRAGGARSLTGDPRVYLSDAVHFSADRSALAIGVAARDVVRLPSKGRGQMDASALDATLTEDEDRGALPLAVIATMGTTGTGAIDDIGAIADVCERHGVWLHVDACYGGAAALLPEFESVFDAVARADSVAVDPHKWFYVPMVAGILFTKHPEAEVEVFDIDAPYIPSGDQTDGFRRGLATSRRCAGFAIWMALRAHGLGAVRDAVALNNALTRQLERRLTEAGFRVMPDGELSIACARWEPAGLAESEIADIQEEIARRAVVSGLTWFGTVRAQGQTWLRFSLVSRHTRASHVDRLVERLAAIAEGLVENGPTD